MQDEALELRMWRKWSKSSLQLVLVHSDGLSTGKRVSGWASLEGEVACIAPTGDAGAVGYASATCSFAS
jgi:hypothetical protein